MLSGAVRMRETACVCVCGFRRSSGRRDEQLIRRIAASLSWKAMAHQMVAGRAMRGTLPATGNAHLRLGRRGMVKPSAAAGVEIPQHMNRRRVIIESDADSKPYVSGFKEGEAVPVPQSIMDINHQQTLGYGEDLAEDHPGEQQSPRVATSAYRPSVCLSLEGLPGFRDEDYKKRRKLIAGLAKTHQIGDSLPVVQYNEKETEIWNKVLDSLEHLFPDRACKVTGFGGHMVSLEDKTSNVCAYACIWGGRSIWMRCRASTLSGTKSPSWQSCRRL